METFRTVIPNEFSLPRRISRLGELAYNLWWTWNYDSQRLYSRIDPVLWEQLNHNPVLFLRQVERSKINAVSDNRYYLDFYDRTLRTLDQYMAGGATWYKEKYPELRNAPVAYFSMEYGLHETLPIYAGGLGVLSGDHAKEASDLGLPFVAIGLFYSEGYFTQRITEDGWQEARYISHVLNDLPVIPVLDLAGKPVTISVELPGREVSARIWEIHVGRVPIYMLDTNIENNLPSDRALTARLYSSDLEVKIMQEILLGIGGVRALRVMGYNPNVWHMNEGHSAFMVLERMREQIVGGASFEKAAENVRTTSIFTTHTPVPAGNDEFALWLVDKYFSHLWPEMGLSRDQFIDLARHNLSWGDAFSMPVLALRFSVGRNAVSELHGRVSREMWKFIWSEKPGDASGATSPNQKVDEVPIIHITNGIHTTSWLARRLRHLYDRYLGPNWMEQADDPQVWEPIKDIPDEELWAMRRHLKRKLAYYIREHARQQWLSGNLRPVQVVASGVLLNPYVLTIGFARRFAPYKRANLILKDLNRLLKIVKMIIQDVYQAVKRPESGGRLIFLENYDMSLARLLVQGVDVWINTPRRPNEASGTSGQKAALNGVLNFSVLDGWWREGYNGRNGWAIGTDTDDENSDRQDEADARSLYDTLENEIVPLYYNLRSSDNLPGDWIVRMKDSIRTLAPQFSMRRMVKEYIEQMYVPAIQTQNNPDKLIR
jgi:starch phosphorylase